LVPIGLSEFANTWWPSGVGSYCQFMLLSTPSSFQRGSGATPVFFAMFSAPALAATPAGDMFRLYCWANRPPAQLPSDSAHPIPVGSGEYCASSWKYSRSLTTLSSG